MAGDKKWVREYHSSGKKEVVGDVTAVVENLAVDPDRDFTYSGDPGVPVFLSASWEGSHSESSDYEETIGGQLIHAEQQTGQVSGQSDHFGIEFSYSDDYKGVSAGIGITAEYHDKRRRFYDEWSESESKYPYNINSSTGCDETGGRDCNIVKVGAGYHVTMTINENEKKNTLGGLVSEIRNVSPEVTITPLKSAVKLSGL